MKSCRALLPHLEPLDAGPHNLHLPTPVGPQKIHYTVYIYIYIIYYYILYLQHRAHKDTVWEFSLSPTAEEAME